MICVVFFLPPQMCELMKGKLIPSAVIKLLWEKFTVKVSDAIVGLSFRDPQFSIYLALFYQSENTVP